MIDTTNKRNSIILLAILIVGVTLATFIPITEQVAYTETESYFVDEPYEVAVTKTVNHNDPIYETVSHSDPVYETIYHSDPVYETVYHNDPIYETLYNIVLIDGSTLGDEVYRISDVYNTNFVYSGTDFWGNSEYTVTVYYYRSIPDGDKAQYTYYEIDESSSTSYTAIVSYNNWDERVVVSYNKWNEQVISGYNEWDEEVMVAYNIWSEEVFSHYETEYQSVEKSRAVTKYEDVTLSLYMYLMK